MRRVHVEELEDLLERLDGARYGAYKRLYSVEIVAECGVARFTRVQGDPYAPPSVLEARGRLRLPPLASRYPAAVSDYGYRLLYRFSRRVSRKRGTGNSGFVGVPRPSNAMLRRSGFEVLGERFVARVWVGLPARGRRILGREAYETIRGALGAICDAVKGVGGEGLERHVVNYAVQEELRERLREEKLAAFIGEGAVLPRRCGWCEEPLPDAVPFEPPPSLRVELETRWGVYAGMGIPRGFTVVTGHPFHGKTTLLEAIAAGVYNHVEGDGRERVVALRSTAWIEAEDGRPVHGVDLSPLIHGLPGRVDPRRFTTSDASGATSMAASIVESLCAGAELLLVDEDRAATNLLHVDERVSKLAGPPPITPLSTYARSLSKLGISVVVVSGALGSLLEEAETVILVKSFNPARVERRRVEAVKPRLPECRRLRTKPWRSKPRPPRLIGRDGYEASLESNRVLVEDGQYNTIAALLSRSWEGTLREIAERVDRLMEEGFEAIVENPPPNLTEVRGLDFIHALARLPPGHVQPS